MTAFKSFYLLILSLSVVSCGDDDVGPRYPSRFHSIDLKISGGIRVFTASGEITGSQLVSQYAVTDSSTFNFFTRSFQANPPVDSIQFLTPGEAGVHDRYRWWTCTVSQKGDNLSLTQAESVARCCSHGEVFTRSVNYYIGQIKPEVSSEYVFSSTRGDYYFGYESREKFTLQGSGNTWIAPIIGFLVHSGGRVKSAEYVNNILQNDFYKNLVTGDTVTLKEYQIVYGK